MDPDLKSVERSTSTLGTQETGQFWRNARWWRADGRWRVRWWQVVVCLWIGALRWECHQRFAAASFFGGVLGGDEEVYSEQKSSTVTSFAADILCKRTRNVLLKNVWSIDRNIKHAELNNQGLGVRVARKSGFRKMLSEIETNSNLSKIGNRKLKGKFIRKYENLRNFVQPCWGWQLFA